MSKRSCLTGIQIQKLEESHGLQGKLSFLSSLSDVADLNNYLNMIPAIKNLSANSLVKFEEDVKSYASSNSRFYVYLRTDDQHESVGFTRNDLEPFSETFNSAFISLYNFTSLRKLVANEPAESKNKGLLEMIEDFLKTESADDPDLINAQVLASLKAEFLNNAYPYESIEENEDAQNFYIEGVFRFMAQFFVYYYNNYYKEEIFKPIEAAKKAQFIGKKTADIIKLDPHFAALSKNKDILKGFIFEYNIFQEAREEEEEKNGSVSPEFIKEQPFFKLATQVMGSFKLNDSSFADLYADDEEDDNDIKVETDDQAVSFERQGNEKSGFEAASKTTRNMLASLFDADPLVKTDEFGMPVLINPYTAFKQLSKVTRGIIDYELFYDKLTDANRDLPFITQLLTTHLINPHSYEKLFTDSKGNPVPANTRLKWLNKKASFLADLSKPAVPGKELVIKVSRKKINVKGELVNTEVIRANVEDARLKSKKTIENDTNIRFQQKYGVNKTPYFGKEMFTKSGIVRITSFYNAANLVKELNKNKFNVSYNQALDLLALFGIVPSANIKGRSKVIALVKNNSKTITNFFTTLPSTTNEENIDLKNILGAINVKITKNLKNNLTNLINTKVDAYSSLRANDSNLKKLKKEIKETFTNVTNLIKVNTKAKDFEKILKDANDDLENIAKKYLENIQDLFNPSKGLVTPIRGRVELLTNYLLDNVYEQYNTLLVDILEGVGATNNTVTVIKKITDPAVTFSDKDLKLENNIQFKKLFEDYSKLEGSSSTAYDDDMYFDQNGKSRSTITAYNNLLIKTSGVTNGNTRIFEKFPDLDPNRNPLITASILYNQFYHVNENVDKSMSITRTPFKGTIDVNNMLGAEIKSSFLNAEGVSMGDLLLGDNLLTSVASLLFDGLEEGNNGDKSASYNIKISDWQWDSYLKTTIPKKNVNNKFLPVPGNIIANMYKAIIDDKGEKNFILKPTAADEFEPIANIYANYLTHYLLLFRDIEIGDLQYVKSDYNNLSKNYAYLGMFEKDSLKDPLNYIITAELKQELKDKVLKLKLNGKSHLEKVNLINELVKNTNYSDFKEGVLNYFKKQTEALYNAIPYTLHNSERSNLVNLLSKKTDGKDSSSLPYITIFSDIKAEGQEKASKLQASSFLKGLLMIYAVNYNILSQEKILMFYEEPIFVKESSYIKRITSSTSTGTYASIDDMDISVHNDPRNKQSFAYAKALDEKLRQAGEAPINLEQFKLGYQYRFGEVSDNEIESAVIKSLESGYRKSFKLKYGENQDIEADIKRNLGGYYSMNEADGFGVITFDYYRLFSILTKTWSHDQEDLYQKICAGEEYDLTDAVTTFPVRKFSYAGSTFTDQKKLPASALHKFSLAPLIPGMDDNLQTKHDNLVKEGKAYEIFSSASKKESLVRKNKKNKFYDGNQLDRKIAPLKATNGVYTSGKDVVYGITSLFKDQVHIDTEIKVKAPLARQLKRAIKTDLFDRGVPVDYKKEEEFEERKTQWDALKYKDQLEASPIFKTYRTIVSNIQKINTQEKQNIFEKLGIAEIKNGRQLTYEVVDKRKLLLTLEKEMQSRTTQQKSSGGNVYSKLLRMESRNNSAELEAFTNVNSLKSIVKNVIDKNTSLRKYNGSNLVQSSVIGSETETFDREKIHASGALKFYEFDDKKTKMAEVMLTFSPRWNHLLTLEFDGAVIGDLKTLNKALENEEWVETHKDKLTMLAVRIPIQDPNSIEGFIIKRFLPSWSGSKIIVPSELVTKSGGDFDIDKLMVYYYNYDKKSGAIPFDDSLVGLENQIIRGYLDLLLLPEMFYKLATANSTAILKKAPGTVEEMIFDKINSRIKLSATKYDNTDLRSPLFNAIYKTALQTAKKLLGHAATIRAFVEEMKHAGLDATDEYDFVLKRYLTKADIDAIKHSEKTEHPFNIDINNKGIKTESARIILPYKTEEGEYAFNYYNGKLSLSNVLNSEKVFISEIISATMNGFVDVGSDPWITALAMNAELTSFTYFQLLAGATRDHVFSFNNQPIVKDFIENKLSLKSSIFKRALNFNRDQKDNRILMDTLDLILRKFIRVGGDLSVVKKALYSIGITEDYVAQYIDNFSTQNGDPLLRQEADILMRLNFETLLFEVFKTQKKEDFFTVNQLLDMVGVDYTDMTEDQLAAQFRALANILFLKPYTEGLTRTGQSIDHDKPQSQMVHTEYLKKSTITNIKKQKYFPKESLNNLIDLNVSAPYNMSALVIDIFKNITPLTENKIINRFAINLVKDLKSPKNGYISAKTTDRFISAFKSDFINFIVQNYGEIRIEDKETGKITKENIVEYAIKNHIFVDKMYKVNNDLVGSNSIEDKSVVNKLATLVDTFEIYSSLEVFNYLRPVKGAEIQEEGSEEATSRFYKLGRSFRTLAPVELDLYNKQLDIFKNTGVKTEDALLALDKKGVNIIFNFVSGLEIDSDKLEADLDKVKEEKNLNSYSEIDINDLTEDSRNAILAFKDTANKVKNLTAKLLPYVSILQSTSSFSDTYISNLFVMQNYRITKQAIDNFIKTEGEVSGSILNDFFLLFLLNNRNLIKNSRKTDFLKIIAGAGETSFSESNILKNAGYFNNYYKKVFDISNPDFTKDTLVQDAISGEGTFISETISYWKDKDESSITDASEEQEANSDADLVFDENYDDAPPFSVETPIETTEVVVDDKSYQLNTADNSLTDTEGNVVEEAYIINKALVQHYSKTGVLQAASFGGKQYFIIGDMVITNKYALKKIKTKEELQKILDLATPFKLTC
jgi:hypothetical protein